jgi:hypothetical protein
VTSRIAAVIAIPGGLVVFTAATAVWRPDFRNIAESAGLVHSFPNGGDVTKKYIIETTGSGAAMVDYDNDGLPDLFVISGDGGRNRLYHNLGNDRFQDVAASVGLSASGWGQGVCAGDYDNDGFTDLFVTYWGQNHLYRNIKGTRFEDVTERTHLRQARVRYNTGCAFTDIDNDGNLDLFLANYLKFDPANTPKPGENPYCFYRGIPVACGPRGLAFDRNILYRNNGDGTFSDISATSGVSEAEGHYGLSVIATDVNNDGLPDIYVACDQTPSLLYVNQGKGKFEEEAMLRGVALDANGKALSGMGVDGADYDGTGFVSLFRSNFSDEMETLYHNRGDGNFDETTLLAGLGKNTRFVGWGAGFFDYDNDGWTDLFLVNGHVFPEVDKLAIDLHFKDRAILYHNLRNGTFQDVSLSSGPAILEKHSSRGAAFGDIDTDGSVEVLVNNQNEPPSLLKLATRPPAHWISFKLTGTLSNRSAVGARIKLTSAGHTQTREVRSGGSYLSQNDFRLHFGLGSSATVERVEIRWPGGKTQALTNLSADKIINVRQQ